MLHAIVYIYTHAIIYICDDICVNIYIYIYTYTQKYIIFTPKMRPNLQNIYLFLCSAIPKNKNSWKLKHEAYMRSDQLTLGIFAII